MEIRGHRFEWGLRTYVAAIINATPDSFSGDGVGGDQTRVARLASAATEAGADIIDIGAESTRPGARPVPVDDELARLIPAIRTVRAETDLPVSADTYKAQVAGAAAGRRRGLHQRRLGTAARSGDGGRGGASRLSRGADAQPAGAAADRGHRRALPKLSI